VDAWRETKSIWSTGTLQNEVWSVNHTSKHVFRIEHWYPNTGTFMEAHQEKMSAWRQKVFLFWKSHRQVEQTASDCYWSKDVEWLQEGTRENAEDWDGLLHGPLVRQVHTATSSPQDPGVATPGKLPGKLEYLSQTAAHTILAIAYRNVTRITDRQTDRIAISISRVKNMSLLVEVSHWDRHYILHFMGYHWVKQQLARLALQSPQRHVINTGWYPAL